MQLVTYDENYRKGLVTREGWGKQDLLVEHRREVLHFYRQTSHTKIIKKISTISPQCEEQLLC